jgi:hypothetical protein
MQGLPPHLLVFTSIGSIASTQDIETCAASITSEGITVFPSHFTQYAQISNPMINNRDHEDCGNSAN